MSDPYTEQARAMAALSAENGLLRAEIERLKAALKPFALNVDAVSLRNALGHITREDLLHARAALEPRPWPES